MGTGELDILVVGGGVTGAGIALDAASRGLRTGIVEATDWAGGTSQWSSKLVHGGLRYLYQLNFPLVAEALKERGLLLTSLAPHLVKAQPFLWPLKTPVIERSYSAIGVGMYDALAQFGGGGSSAVPHQKHYGRAGALELFPGMREDALVGAIRFYDARVDDARLVLDLVRTAAGLGALAANRAKVVEYVTEGERVVGAVVEDAETGQRVSVRARYVVNATGVWTEQTQNLVPDAARQDGLRVLASKGIHIVVPRERIRGEAGLFLRTEVSVLFVIPWDRYWVIGTTDTPWHEDVASPVATSRDIDYVLEQANSVLAEPLTRDDIIGTYAGLRPLLQPHDDDASSTKVSREHTVTEVAPGLAAIAGGKLTTYRVMAEDAVDFALTQLEGPKAAEARPSITERTPLVGAAGYPAWQSQAHRVAAEHALSPERVQHLLDRYGDELPDLLATMTARPELARPLEHAPDYLRVEIAYAVTHEGALHLEDVLCRRTRLDYEVRDRGLAALDEIGAIVADLLGWDAERLGAEQGAYRDRVEGIMAAERQPDDASAVAALHHHDTAPAA
ncbi:MAG: glycerol-3-phosphate dehydrogenase/oxidase [Micrococcales bacterium]|nr:glycerol-3-phosphate dehydrogenase/oxidase [Micrococcales bacterium]